MFLAKASVPHLKAHSHQRRRDTDRPMSSRVDTACKRTLCPPYKQSEI